MKEDVSIIIIDDTIQETNIRLLEIRLNKICNPRIEQIHTGSIDLRKDDGSEHLDIVKLTKVLEEKLKYRRIDWIVTDFNLGEDEIDGIDVIRIMLKIKEFKRKNIILYSGNIQAAIRKILKETEIKDSEEAIIKAVTRFIDLPILKFEGRQDYSESLVELVSKNQRPPLEDRFLKLLNQHKQEVFKSCFPEFAGKTFGEIAKIIEDGSDARSDEWLQAIIEQTISYLLKVNE